MFLITVAQGFSLMRPAHVSSVVNMKPEQTCTCGTSVLYRVQGKGEGGCAGGLRREGGGARAPKVVSCS